jgi:hypothetical protein
LGPIRDCIRAQTRRSSQLVMPAIGKMKTNTTIAPNVIMPRRYVTSWASPSCAPNTESKNACI